ncbi:MAG: dipeptide ABC transporter ATP-binding protein [Pseudomonadales bacterium]
METLLSVRDVRKHFPILKGFLLRQAGAVKAVDGVSFDVFPGETLGLVGESGCGKSTLGRTLVRLYEPTSGSIRYKGQDFLSVEGEALRAMRQNIQMIFQDPFASLDPRMTVSRILAEPFKVHDICGASERQERAAMILQRVGLQTTHLNRYPHEFSGGQRQRISIARAIALNPELVIADEPVSALDVSIQAQILNLMRELQEEFKLTYVFISHDLSVVDHFCDRIAVMYLGKIVELATKDELFNHPKHPYTRALIDAIPRVGAGKKQMKQVLTGEVPSPITPPSGCHFHPRCPKRFEGCDRGFPALQALPGSQPLSRRGQEHLVACKLYADAVEDDTLIPLETTHE